MEKFIPFEKLSKRERQKRNAARRGSWHGLNPVTRKSENSKAYNRQKARKWSDDSMTVPFAYLGYLGAACDDEAEGFLSEQGYPCSFFICAER